LGNHEKNARRSNPLLARARTRARAREKEKDTMIPIRTIPNAPHLVGIQVVRELFAHHSGNAGVGRSTVTEWLNRRGIKAHGASPTQRLFDRAGILAALEKDFPTTPRFITVEDAFLMAGRAYPNARNKVEP
jgi:hypothetical protein